MIPSTGASLRNFEKFSSTKKLHSLIYLNSNHNEYWLMKMAVNISLFSPEHTISDHFKEGTSKLVFAYHPHDPHSPMDLLKHSIRGQRSVMLLNSLPGSASLPKDVKHFDLMVDKVICDSFFLLNLIVIKTTLFYKILLKFLRI